MTDKLVVSFSSYITELVTTFGILKKFKRQIYKLENKLFDKGLGFEKIKVKTE